MHHHECVCARHLALPYKQGTEHHRNSDVAISHSSPFSLLVNKPKAACILYKPPWPLLRSSHESALTVFCINLLPVPNSPRTPKAHTTKPCSGRGASGVARSPQPGPGPGACRPAAQRPTLRLSARAGKTPLQLYDQWQALLRVCFAGEH